MFCRTTMIMIAALILLINGCVLTIQADRRVDISELLNQQASNLRPKIARSGFVPRNTKEAQSPTLPEGIDLRRLPFTLTKGIDPRDVRRCQFSNGSLWPSATECEDELESESCRNIFGTGQPRPSLCLNSELSDLAKRCAKTCRLCCESPKFNCADSGAQLIDCQAHRAKCKEPMWQRIMMAVCEHTCGFCSADKCFDLAPDCPSLRSLCFNRPVSPLYRQQCPHTCGLCQPGGGDGEGKEQQQQKAPGEVILLVKKKKNRRKCEDLSPSCGDNPRLCNDENYATLFREKCAKTCGHCQDNGEEEEEETMDMVKRIRHGKAAAVSSRRPMERPPAVFSSKRQRPEQKNRARSGMLSPIKERPIIIIDNRKMFVQRPAAAARKERLNIQQEGGEEVQISREVLADQPEERGESIGPSPIVIFFSGNKEGPKERNGSQLISQIRRGSKSEQNLINANRGDFAVKRRKKVFKKNDPEDEEGEAKEADENNEIEEEEGIFEDQAVRKIREEADEPAKEKVKNGERKDAEKVLKEENSSNDDRVQAHSQRIKGSETVKAEDQQQEAIMVESILEENVELNLLERGRNRLVEDTQTKRNGFQFDEKTKEEAKQISEQILGILKTLPTKADSSEVESARNEVTRRQKRETSQNATEEPEEFVKNQVFRMRSTKKKQPDKMEEMVEELLQDSKGKPNKSVAKSEDKSIANDQNPLGMFWAYTPESSNVEEDDELEYEEAAEADEMDNFRRILELLGQDGAEEEKEERQREEDERTDDNSSSEGFEADEEEESGEENEDEETEQDNQSAQESAESKESEFASSIMPKLKEEKFGEEGKVADGQANILLANAGVVPELRAEQGQQEELEAILDGKKPAKIIRVRVRPKSKAQKKKTGGKRMDSEEEEEDEEEDDEKMTKLRRFDGILRDRQGKALRLEELKGGIQKALAQVRRRYGLGNWTSEDASKTLLDTGRDIKSGLSDILAELKALEKPVKQRRQKVGNKRGGRKRGEEEEEEEAEEVKAESTRVKRKREEKSSIEDEESSEEEEEESKGKIHKEDDKVEEKRVLNALEKLLGVRQQKSTRKQSSDVGRVNALMEIIKRAGQASSVRIPQQQNVALVTGGDGRPRAIRLVPVAVPDVQRRLPFPSGQQQFVVTGQGGQMDGGQFLQPRPQPQLIVTNGQPFQPQSLILQPQQIQPQVAQAVAQPVALSPTQQPSQPQQIVVQLPPQPQPSFPAPAPQFQPPQAVQEPLRPQRPPLALGRFSHGLVRNTNAAGIRQQQISANCRDFYPYCEQIVPRGFCTSEFYPIRMKRQFCPQSCNLC